jgi:hypothetical protein
VNRDDSAIFHGVDVLPLNPAQLRDPTGARVQELEEQALLPVRNGEDSVNLGLCENPFGEFIRHGNARQCATDVER